MFLSRIRLRSRAAEDRSIWHAFRDEYQIHRTVWSFFGETADRSRDFLYRVDRAADGNVRRPVIWTLSTRAPVVDATCWHADTKTVDPKLETGDRLRFSLRVNAVVKRDGKRHDVIMDAKKKMPSGSRVPTAEIAQRAVEEWFQKRAEGWGMSIEGLVTEGGRVWRFRSPGDRLIQLGVCDVSGVHRVQDPGRFLERWRRGFGPAKGFGCGLMLMARSR